ncbi:hypothetical protein [Nostoc sp.]
MEFPTKCLNGHPEKIGLFLIGCDRKPNLGANSVELVLLLAN